MNSSKPSGYTEAVQKQEPWGPAAGHLKDIFGASRQLYETGGPKMYPGTLTAPPAPETLQAQEMRANRARLGDPLTRGAKGYTAGVLSGDYAAPKFGESRLGRTATDYATRTAGGGFMGQNPFLEAMVDRASQGVVRNYQRAVDPGLRSRAIMTGRTGPNAATTGARRQSQEVLGETLGGIASDIYGRDYAQERGLQQQAAFAAPGLALPDIGQYQAERGRMEAAAGRAPALGAFDYADIDALSQVGGEREAQEERRIGEAVQKHTYTQEQPYEALRRYMDFVRGAPGGTTTTQEPIYRNRGAGALGGGLAGAQIGSLLGLSNPWLAALGGAGALAGYM